MKPKPQPNLLFYDPSSDRSFLEYDNLLHSSKGDPLLGFTPLSLEDLGNAALLDREETKFVLPENRLGSLLPGLEPEYHILEIKGEKSFDYLSVYLDSPDRIFYHQHQSGTRPRWKIRLRTYLNTGISFLEVKQKDNRDQTHKTRQRINPPIYNLSKIHRLLQGTSYPGNTTNLTPVLKTYYTRMTLVHNEKQERITLDRQLRFSNHTGSQSLTNLVVVEIKQERFNPRSPFLIRLKQIKVQPTRFSKYCLGSLLLDPTLKHNRFKPILHQIMPLTLGGNLYEWIL
jgi:hypothetical protein